MPVPVIDHASPLSDPFRNLEQSGLGTNLEQSGLGTNLLESALQKAVPSASSYGDASVPIRLGGEQLRSLAMPTAQEIASARRRLHAKATIIAVALAGGFCALIAPFTPLLFRPIAFVVVVISLIMVATSIMHDANHGAFFAKSERANNTVGYLADLLGVSSLLWRIKHNIHHADTNVQGIDADIDQGAIARLADTQDWKPWHRFQHLYLWPLYGLMGVQWLVLSDFTDLIRGRVADKPITDVRFRSRAAIIGGKALHVAWALALPMVWNPWWAVIGTYLAGSWLVGLVLAVTFQVAHCVDNAEFALPDAARRDDDFVWHQLKTTVDVLASRSLLGRFRSMLVGGLDYQIEHHLAPSVPHTAYPAMAKRLRALCDEYGITYRSHRSVGSAIASHARWLRLMGTNPAL
jgi:linoleoyl-CoA desaturase